MDKLQWFKFCPSDWMMGRIQRCPEVTQARYLRLCCLYWNKEAVMSLEDAEIEVGESHLNILINKKIIKINDILIQIDFLDEQYKNILLTSRKNSKAGKISAIKRATKAQHELNERSTGVQRNPTDKIRQEEKREENTIKESSNSSSLLFKFQQTKLRSCKTNAAMQEFGRLNFEDKKMAIDYAPIFIREYPKELQAKKAENYLRDMEWHNVESKTKITYE